MAKAWAAMSMSAGLQALAGSLHAGAQASVASRLLAAPRQRLDAIQEFMDHSRPLAGLGLAVQPVEQCGLRHAGYAKISIVL